MRTRIGSGKKATRKAAVGKKRNRYLITLLSTTVLFIGAGVYFAQTKSQTTDNKADKNLKSMSRINPSTLAMEFSIPLGAYPGRAGNGIPVALNYSSKVWTMERFHTWRESYHPTLNDGVNWLVLESTDIAAIFSKRSALGWTSSLQSPAIIQGLERYNQSGESYEFINLGRPESLTGREGCTFISSTLEVDFSCASGWGIHDRYACDDPSTPQTEHNIYVTCVPTRNQEPGGGIGGPPPSPTPFGTPVPSFTPQTAYSVKRVQVAMPDGSTQEFRKSDKLYNCGDPSEVGDCDETPHGAYLSTSGNGMTLELAETQPDLSVRHVLYMPNGSRYIFPTGTPPAGHLVAEKFIDLNGNFSTFDSSNRTWTDTLDNDIKDPLPNALLGEWPATGTQEITLPGVGNTHREYEIKWAAMGMSLESTSTTLKYLGPDRCTSVLMNPISGASLFANEPENTDPDVTQPTNAEFKRNQRVCGAWGGEYVFNPTVMSELSFPNGEKYAFKYNEYGEITKIIYPTGGYERFVYDTVEPMGFNGLGVYKQANRGVKDHYISFDGVTESQHWSYEVGTSGVDYMVTTHAPDGSRSERVLHRSGGYGYGFELPLSGMVMEERVYDAGSPSKLRSRTINEWTVLGGQGTDPFEYASRDPRLKRSVTISFERDDGTAALATMSETEYDESGSSDPKNFSHLNVKRKKGYHYASISDKSTVDNDELSWTTISGWFSGKLAAVSETDYDYHADYLARGIASRPIATWMLDPGNPDRDYPLGKTQIAYDQQGLYALVTGESTVGWEDPGSILRGNATTTSTWVKETDTWLSAHAKYDNFGNLRKAWDVSGDSSKFVETEYSSTYKYAYPTKVISPAPTVSSNAYVTTETSDVETIYDLSTGLPLKVIDDFGQETTMEYDNMLRPVRVNPVVVSGVATGPVSETHYGTPVNGQYPANERFVKVIKQIDANNWDEAVTFFDGLGRTIKTVAKDSQGDVIVETHYDSLGRADMVTNPYRAGDTVWWNKTRFDELGRAVESYAPASYTDAVNNTNLVSLGTTSLSFSTVTNYVGTVVTSSDASGRKGRSITNALGQLLRVDEPTAVGGTADADLGFINSPAQPTYYTYDPYGNMVMVAQGGTNGQKRYFKYDSLGRLIRVRQPEQEINPNIWLHDAYNTSSQWTAAFTYDDLGNVLTAVDARHVTTANTYDRLGRVLGRAYYGPDPAVLSPPVAFFYDGKGLDNQQTPINFAKGKLTNVSTDGVSETRYKLFDNFGRLKEMQQRTPATPTETIATATPRVSKYTYNFSGALIEEEYPSGRKVKNEFEPDGDLKRIYGKATSTAAEQTYANSFSYTPDGKIAKLRLGNGLWESAQFNNRLQPTEIAMGHSVGDGSLWKLTYQYGELATLDGDVNTDKNTGNIARQTVSFNGSGQPFVQSYKYDSLYRLTEARETKNTYSNQTWKQAFGYDVYGNRTGFTQAVGANQTSGTPAVDAATNRFTSTNFTYDKNGNITADIDPLTSTTRQFVFNGDNKQVEVNAGSTNIGKYYYDGEGKRVKKVTQTETTIFVYSAGKLAEEYTTATPPSSPTINYTATDLLGSPRVLTDKWGNVTSRRDFMPFGEEIFADGTNRTTAGKYSNTGEDSVRKRFTGYEKDRETSLDFAEARYYQNLHGRFTAVDPLLASGKSENPQSFNRYVYVLNNPLIFTDPTGLQAAQGASGATAGDEEDGLLFPRAGIAGELAKARQRTCQSFGGCEDGGTSTTSKADVQAQASFTPLGFGRIVPGTFWRDSRASYWFDKNDPLKAKLTDACVYIDITTADIVYSPVNVGGVAREIPKWGLHGFDERGHIIGRALGGQGDADNLFSQHPRTNRGVYYSLERQIRTILTANQSWTAKVRVSLGYDHSGSRVYVLALAMRPQDKFRANFINYEVRFVDSGGQVTQTLSEWFWNGGY